MNHRSDEHRLSKASCNDLFKDPRCEYDAPKYYDFNLITEECYL